ncbi:MAG: AAA family ATPase [Planctomycetes bacterium]|nr:AAA family ATPase [Planctomycetota bacterium]MCC7171473.1 AAA family ATPase [Planctomycetota bacterium]
MNGAGSYGRARRNGDLVASSPRKVAAGVEFLRLFGACCPRTRAATAARGRLLHSRPPDRNSAVHDDETLRALDEALQFTPANAKLRLHLVKLLRERGRLDDAEKLLREGLKLDAANSALYFALAEIYFAQGKDSHASVALETLMAKGDASAAARVLLARLRLKSGDVEGAVSAYRDAIEADASIEDPALSEQLGVGRHAAGPVSEGRMHAGDDADDEAASDDQAERLVERPKITFKDVGGMESVKQEIDLKIIQPLLHPDLYRAYGKSIGGGILLYGPPGCGKTHLARATAGQVQAGFMAVGIHDVLDMWMGNSERNLHAIFQRARSHTPFVLFFDEVDALGGTRSSMSNSGMRVLVNQFLDELDGAKASNDGVLIVAATNAPWQVDSAFRRPGRFDRLVFVPPPDEVARAEVLRVMLAGKPAADVDVAKVAKKCDGYSGADLKGLVDVAIEAKLKDAIKTGKPQPLTTSDLLDAIKRVKPSTKEWFATARNYVLYSNESGIYDDVARYMGL